MKTVFKIALLIVFAMLALLSYSYTKKSLSYNYKMPNIEQMVQSKLKNGYVDVKIKEAIANKNFEEVKMYVDLANNFKIELKPSTKELIKQNNTTSKKIVRGIKNFVSGFISGKAKNGTEVAGAITSDFTVYGDLRDISIQGQKYIKNEPYDKLILGLSMAGLALTATTFVTLGSSSGLKVATSTLKLAKREKALSKNFSKTLSKNLDKSINFKALKNIKYGSLKEIKGSAKVIKNSVNIAPLKPIFKNLRTIEKSTSIADTVHLLKYVDNTKELKSVAKLSKRYKSATKGIFKLFGKNTFRLVKVGIKWTNKYILSLFALFVSTYAFLVTLIRLFFPKKA